MSSHYEMHGPTAAIAREYRDYSVDFDVLRFEDGDGDAKIFMRESMLGCAKDMAQVFNMHANGSPFLGLLDLLLTAENDPNSDTIADLARALQFHADACCPACGQYRPDEDAWRDIDGRLMCESCADEEAAQHVSDLTARDLRGNLGLAIYAMTEGM